MEQQATLSPSVPLPGGPNSCKYAGDRPGSAGSDQRSVSGSSAGTGSGIGAWRSRSRSRGREATKAIFSGLATSPATAAPAASYGMRDEESPLSPVALHSPASSLRSPSSPASHKSLSVARSVSSRSLKDKAGGFLSRLFAHKEQRDTPDASNPSSDEISHPLRHRGSGSSTSRDPISAVLAADPLRFKSVKQADSRTSTRKLVPPSNNEFAAMFPTLVRSINDVPDLRDTGFKVFKITVHSFSDTRHINVSESDDGFMIRFEVYKAFEIPHSQWGIGLYSIYNSKNFGAATKDLNDDALYQLVRQSSVPDLILIPNIPKSKPVSRQGTVSEVNGESGSTLSRDASLDGSVTAGEQYLLSPRKPKPSLSISTTPVLLQPVVSAITREQSVVSIPGVKRFLVETPTTASPTTFGHQSKVAHTTTEQPTSGNLDFGCSTSSPLLSPTSESLILGQISAGRAPSKSSLTKVLTKNGQNAGVDSPKMPRRIPTRKLKTRRSNSLVVRTNAPIPLPRGVGVTLHPDGESKSLPRMNIHRLRHSAALEDLHVAFGDRPSAPTIVQNLSDFFPSIVVDEHVPRQPQQQQAIDNITSRATSSASSGGTPSARPTVKDGKVLVTRDTMRIIRENSQRSMASTGSSLARRGGGGAPSRLGTRVTAFSFDSSERDDSANGASELSGGDSGSPEPSFDSSGDINKPFLTMDRLSSNLGRNMSLVRRSVVDERTIKRNVTEVWKRKVAELGPNGGLFVSLDEMAVQETLQVSGESGGLIGPRASFESDASSVSAEGVAAVSGDGEITPPVDANGNKIQHTLWPPLLSLRRKKHTWKGFVPQRGPPDEDIGIPLYEEPADMNVDIAVPDVSVIPPAAEETPANLPPRNTIEELEAASNANPSKIIFCRGNMIGQGSFGAVYFGVNLATNELIAVKQVQLVPLKAKHGKPSPSSSRVQKMVEALSVEISLLRELSHEHVVRYLGFDVVDHVVSVFLEYVDGGSLASMLSRYGRFEYGLAQSVTNQMLSGLEYLHDRCIIHRDIKGANILVNKLGVVKIADFGISKKNEYKYQTNSRMSVQGTVFWMAPEVMTNKGGGYSAKVDIWSLGCVVYEMLQGHHPWQNLNEMQIMWKVGMEKAAPPVPDNCREDAKEFLARCFVVEPESRPTARELFSCIFPSVDPAEFDFKEWLDHVEEKRQAETRSEDTIDDEDEDEESSDASRSSESETD